MDWIVKVLLNQESQKDLELFEFYSHNFKYSHKIIYENLMAQRYYVCSKCNTQAYFEYNASKPIVYSYSFNYEIGNIIGFEVNCEKTIMQKVLE